MTYIENILGNNETIVYTGNITKWIVLQGVFVLTIGLILMLGLTHKSDLFQLIFVLVFLIGGTIQTIYSIIYILTTEIVITNLKVVLKVGLIFRDTIELNNDDIEGVQINQTVVQRILGYGTIIITGNGSTEQTISYIDRPLEFRKYII